MSRFDRYLLSQFFVLFGFFSLVLVLVYWINRAVVLFDQLIADGQSAGVFLEFTVLSLPNVIRLVLPLSTFAASVYVTNRLSSESELTVMQATGFSPWRLARPVFYFGLIVGIMMLILTHELVPRSLKQLTVRSQQVAENVTARLLTEGTFIHPSEGVTFYISDIDNNGVLRNIFLSDRRDETETTTYTAAEAYMVRDDSGPKLVMLDGMTQFHQKADDKLFVTRFENFSYDIGSLLGVGPTAGKSLRFLSTPELLLNTQAVIEDLNSTSGWVLEEGHARFTQAFLCVLAAVVGFATLLLGGYSRFGVWRQVAVAFLLLIGLEILKSAVTDPVRENGALWPLLYLPTVLGVILTLGMLSYASSPVRLKRKPALNGGGGDDAPESDAKGAAA